MPARYGDPFGETRALVAGGGFVDLSHRGVVRVSGGFSKGDVVALCDPEGVEFARGLSNYSATDAERIRGLRTEQIGVALGTLPYEEIIHRDNLVVTL